MKICVDIRSLMHPHYSGVPHYTNEIIKHMIELKSDHDFILFYNSRKNRTQFIPNFQNKNTTIKFTKFPNKLLKLAMKLLSWPKFDDLCGLPEVLFIPNYDFINTSKKTPYVLTVHDLSFEKFPEFFNLKYRLAYWLMNTKKISRRAKHIIAVSENTKKDLVDIYKIEPEKITVVPEGVNKIFFQKKSDQDIKDIKIKYNLPDKFALYVGTIEPRKNIQSIIKAIKTTPECHLVIIGNKGWKCDEVFEEIKKNNDKISYLNFLPTSDLAIVYAAARVLLWPSFYEGFGLPPLEAQACGTPVIVGSHSSLKEIIGSSGILIDSDNLNSLKIALSLVYDNDQVYEYYKDLGIKNSNFYTWNAASQKTLEILEKYGENRN